MTKSREETTILVVDDDPSITASLSLLLRQQGFGATVAEDPDDAIRQIRSGVIDLVLQDMNFSRSTTGEEGLSLLRRIREVDPVVPVVLITAWGSIGLAVEGMKAGASDFIPKPWSNAALLASLETALSLAASNDPDRPPERIRDRGALDRDHEFSGIVGSDPELLRILAMIGRVAPTDASVLITGESGTGKELVAEAIHLNSRRRRGPFVKVNLGGISSTLFESEMFGHVKGAFTDAKDARKGRFEVADGGTIFLDEIGEIDLNSQVKLLRVLQDRTYEVLGSSRSRTVDVRVISATNRPVAEMVAEGSFREDLLYRLNLITIRLPPLRDRPSDIPILSRHFAAVCSQSYGRSLSISPGAIRWLQRQSWPGNIRQLRQVIERAVLLHETDVLTESELVSAIEIDQPREADGQLPAAGSMTLDEIEREMIDRCLRHYEGNVTKVAEALGLSRAALYRRFEKYGLEP
ncbi:MAG: sigma-54 dependent transcriptional regulator [Acidobacteria bacterium]|nr:sigma-54 dependent transcriptional regulator [Acidobacteriota bacterium]